MCYHSCSPHLIYHIFFKNSLTMSIILPYASLLKPSSTTIHSFLDFSTSSPSSQPTSVSTTLIIIHSSTFSSVSGIWCNHQSKPHHSTIILYLFPYLLLRVFHVHLMFSIRSSLFVYLKVAVIYLSLKVLHPTSVRKASVAAYFAAISAILAILFCPTSSLYISLSFQAVPSIPYIMLGTVTLVYASLRVSYLQDLIRAILTRHPIH